MQALHAQIEGSSKFAPTTPGRHIVAEMDGITALNAATYKVAHAVRFVVLDDAVLVARRRRKNAGAERASTVGRTQQGKLIAEKCWSLNDMLVLDTKDSASASWSPCSTLRCELISTSGMTNVFKIRHGKETHVYRTENATDKKTLLSHFRQVAEELAEKKRKEREGEHERRKTLWAGDVNFLQVVTVLG
jgi:exocyst complex component 8